MNKKIVIITAALCAAIAVFAVLFLKSEISVEPPTAATTVKDTSKETSLLTEALTTEKADETTESAETAPLYKSPKDFSLLRETYPHIHGWLEIPGSYIDYPIVQHPTDDKYYDRLSADGVVSQKGCIYTEHVYNRTDFEDYVTVLYGHYAGNKGNYEFFGGLQEMYSLENYENYKDITIYHENKELHYQFYAATKYDSEHIPWTYDFSSRESYNAFLDRLRSIDEENCVFAPDVTVRPGDKLLIMSTCYDGGYDANKNVRFIVVAKLVEKITENVPADTTGEDTTHTEATSDAE